jgi:Cytochrome c554 and c-prime
VPTPDAPRARARTGSSVPLSTPVILAGLAVIATFTFVGALSWRLLTDAVPNAPRLGPYRQALASLTFVGSKTCGGCHQTEFGSWQFSQHKHAMDHATDKSMFGDFAEAKFDYHGVQSRFFRKDGKFLVETDGPDGKLGVFEIKYTFGVYPLQQYLIEFADGRLQALSIAWDTRPKEQGGQHWFHLYPNEEIKHDDILHWTKLNQNWNFMCAECHSTGLHKNYDAVNDRYATTFAEINVGCEACHGAGSNHVGWAQERQRWSLFSKLDDPSMGLVERFSERRDATWTGDAETGNAHRSSAQPARRSRDLRPLPCASRRVFRKLGPRAMAIRYPRGLAPRPWALSRRRANARRGL